MFSYCADPSSLSGLSWLSCYLTTNTHLYFYASFLTVLALLVVTAPLALTFGFAGAMARRSSFFPLKAFGNTYTNMVRGVPDIVFFMFVPIALDQALEYSRHLAVCPADAGPVYQGNDFVVCSAAKLPQSSSGEWVHSLYDFSLATIGFSIVFGAFAANVIHGALRAVPPGQLEAGKAIGMTNSQVFWRIHVPQMWTFALAGLSNLWVILIKATPLLFLMGIEDIVYWAGFLGATKTSAYYDYPHPDWRLWYFSALLIFYILMTWGSERILLRIRTHFSKGQATMGSMSDTGVRA